MSNWTAGPHELTRRWLRESGEMDQVATTSFIHRPARKPWYRRPRYWVPALILAILAACRLSLTPLLDRKLRSALENLDGYSAGYEDLSLNKTAE